MGSVNNSTVHKHSFLSSFGTLRSVVSSFVAQDQTNSHLACQDTKLVAVSK